MRVGFDATPLLGPRTGVGTYTDRLVNALAHPANGDVELVATPFSARGTHDLAAQLPPGARIAGRRLPARALMAAWSRTDWPPIELLTGRVDVFHGTNFVAPPARRAGLVVTIHDLAYLHRPADVAAASLRYQTLVPSALRRGAVVCAVSNAMAAEIIDAYDLDPQRVHTTSLGVDATWFADQTPTGPQLVHALPDRYVIAVGTIEPRKNIAALVDAYRLAADRSIELPPLVLVGAQGWGAQLDTAGVPEHLIIRTGHLPAQDLRYAVSRAAALAFPSQYEGFGLPPLEALALGVPVLATDLAVTREVLSDQAVFVDSTSAEALVEGLRRVLDDPPGTPQTRRQHAGQFTWERCATKTLGAYVHAATAR